MFKPREALDNLHLFSIVFIFISSLTMLPSYLYRIAWRVAWYNWSPAFLLIFLTFLSPLFWKSLKKRWELGNVSYDALLITQLVCFIIFPILPDFAFRGIILSIILASTPPLFERFYREGKENLLGLLILLSLAIETLFRMIFISFDFRLTLYGSIFFSGMTMVILYNIIYDIRNKETNNTSIKGIKVKFESYLTIIFLIFMLLNLFIRSNTYLRLAIVNYGLLQFSLTSLTILITICLSAIFANKYILRGDYLVSSLLVIGVSLLLFFWFKGLVALFFLPILVFFFSLYLLFAIGGDRKGRDLYSVLTVSYVFYLVLSLIYTFIFVYAYIPGIYVFSGKMFEFFIGVFLIMGLLLTKKFIVNEKKLSLRLTNKVSGVFLILLVLSTPFMFLAMTSENKSTGVYGEIADSFRVMSYNIHQGYDLYDRFSAERILDVIKSSKADVIGLQEVDTGRITSDYIDNLLYIASKLGYYSIYEPAIGGTYGVAVISRYPIEKVDSLKLTSSGEQRVMLHVKVKLNSIDVNFITLHLGLESKERIIQINEAISHIQKINGPVIVTGDFNALPNSTEIGTIKEYLNDARSVSLNTTGPAETWPSKDPSLRIDYIFVNDYFVVKNFETIETTASDHLPIVADLKIPSTIYSGSMYANDAGEPKGGFEWAGEYNISLHVYEDGSGYIKIKLHIGLGDPLTKHVYAIKGFEINSTHMVFEIYSDNLGDWVKVTLRYYETDPIWGTFNGYYIAHYVDPNIFSGFVSHFYVELRLKPEV